MTLKNKARQLPSSPGVYLMKDSFDAIIYVGKSKNLKSRVQSYFQTSSKHSKKVEKLVKNIRSFDIIKTDTEFEALLLECQLIKQLQPIFNRMMKNPQVYCYISVHVTEEYPSIKIVNSTGNNEHQYFGPFPNRNRIETAVQGLKEFFQIDCSAQANQQKACLNYSLGLCMGICLGGEEVKRKYHSSLNQIINFLSGNDDSLFDEMEKKMNDASESLDFEMAAKYRDYLEALHTLHYKEKVLQFAKEDKKLLVVEPLDDRFFKLFLMEGDRVLFQKKYEWDLSKLTILCKKLKAELLPHIEHEIKTSSHEIQKDKIDEAQIIYSYVQNAEYCIYIEDESEEQLGRLLMDLLKKAANPKMGV